MLSLLREKQTARVRGVESAPARAPEHCNPRLLATTWKWTFPGGGGGEVVELRTLPRGGGAARNIRPAALRSASTLSKGLFGLSMNAPRSWAAWPPVHHESVT